MGALGLLVKTIKNFANLLNIWQINRPQIILWIKYVLVAHNQLIICFAVGTNHGISLRY